MHRPVEGQVHADVPLQPIDRSTATADTPFRQGRMVGDVVGDVVPMPGRGFRVRAVGPELRDRPGPVTDLDHVGRVGLAGERVDRMTLAVIGTETIVAVVAGREVGSAVGAGLDETAEVDQLEHRLLDLSVADTAELRRTTGIEDRGDRADSGGTVCRGRRIPRRHVGVRERSDVTPGDADERLQRDPDDDPVLQHQVVERQGLPAIGKEGVDSGQLVHQCRVEREVAGVVGVAQVQPLERTVAQTIVNHRLADPVADRCRRIPLGRTEVGVVAQLLHRGPKVGLGGERPRLAGLPVSRVEASPRETMHQQTIGRMADRLAARRRGIGGRVLVGVEVAGRVDVVAGPGVPHRHGQMEQVAGMHRGLGPIDADGIEQGLVPDPGDALVGIDRRRRGPSRLGPGRPGRPAEVTRRRVRGRDRPGGRRENRN